MKLKFLFILPMVLCSGILLGHLMLALATVTIPDPGHPASHIGAGTFADDGNYIFKQGAKVGINVTNPSLTLDVNGDVRVGGARISFTGVDGAGFSWIRRSYLNDNDILIGWDSSKNTFIKKDLVVEGTIMTKGFVGPRVKIVTGPDELKDNQWHNVTCPPDYAMIGMSVKLSMTGPPSTLVNGWDGYLTVKCSDVSGSLDNTQLHLTDVSDILTDNLKTEKCPSEYVATGVNAYATTFMTKFALKCTKIKIGSEPLFRASYRAESERAVKNALEKGYFCMPGTFLYSLTVRYRKESDINHLIDDDNNRIECLSIYH